MTNLLLHNYYYRYREQRKQAKALVDSNDFVGARTRLEAAITEHESKFPDINNNDFGFNRGENIVMKHALRHLDKYIVDGDSPVLKDDGVTIETQTDNIKNILLYQVKSDYSSLM